MYALIHNNQIQVGPRQWLYSFFKDYLDEENLDATLLPRLEPSEPVIADDWKILPVDRIEIPTHDLIFEQLAGPYLTIGETSVTGYFDVVPVELYASKAKMKEIVTNNRYSMENNGTKFTFDDDQEVKLFTNRQDRNTYIQTYQIMDDGSSISFKFPNSIFRTVTKEELKQVSAAVASWVQSSFDWETEKYTAIDAATTVDELKTIDVQIPSWVENNAG